VGAAIVGTVERSWFMPPCAFCGQRIGVYEPTVELHPEGARMTSLARDPLLVKRGMDLLHAACAELNEIVASPPLD
jgi:hypothetical protein